MRPNDERRVVLHLAACGLNASQIADIAAIPRTTVRDWLRWPRDRQLRARAELSLELDSLPKAAYSYLLGFTSATAASPFGRRGVYRLRIKTDVRYPAIIVECAAAMQAVMPENRVSIQKRAVEIRCHSKRWPLLFPQHGPGRKHERRIVLESWQEEIVASHPREFLRGLIHSDGCRVLNRVNGKDYPRYFFTQVSDDIRRLLCDACRRLGVAYTGNNWKTVSIARASSVALLDAFVGPKA